MKFRGGEFPTGTKGNFQPELTFSSFLGNLRTRGYESCRFRMRSSHFFLRLDTKERSPLVPCSNQRAGPAPLIGRNRFQHRLRE